MPLYIPGTDDLYESGLDNLIQALLNRNAVITGGAACQVIAHVGPDMGVRVGAGTIQGAAVRVPVAQTDLVVAANASGNPRIDLVSVNFTTGVPAITAGTPGQGKPPALPAGHILLGYVTVVAGAVNIQNANITDRRLFLPAYEDVAADSGRQNLITNSDYGRRTSMGLAMPEAFADVTAMTLVNGAGVGTVAANILTAGNTGSWWVKWCATNNTFFHNGRWSAQFKAVVALPSSQVMQYTDGNNWVRAFFDGAGNFVLGKTIGGANTTIGSVAQAVVLNNWYWGEIEKQNTTYIAKLYSSGAAPVAKASATLLQTLTGAVADAAVQVGWQPAVVSSDATVSQWGGVSTGNGGVYVETWLPEGWTVLTAGTVPLGGQAISYDESANSGPTGTSRTGWSLQVYIPATNRILYLVHAPLSSSGANIAPSTTYTFSFYAQATGLSGVGDLIDAYVQTEDAAGGSLYTTGQDLASNNPPAWARKTITFTTQSTARRFRTILQVNPGSNAAGLAKFMLPQLEQSAVVSAWRSAPADDAPIPWISYARVTSLSTTSVSFVELEPSGLAISFFLPWDANVDMALMGGVSQNTLAQAVLFQFSVDGVGGANIDSQWNAAAANTTNPLVIARRMPLAAGFHRITMNWRVSANTGSFGAGNELPRLMVTAYRGKS